MSDDYPHNLSSPRVYFFSMLVFLGLVAFLVMILYRSIASFFMTNPGLNGLILGVLFVGILLSFLQVLRLMPEVSWVNSLRRGDMDKVHRRNPVLLSPMAVLFRDSGEVTGLSTISTQSILDSIGNRLSERREISRYLISLMVFLGLLGTFWGLLNTIGSIGDTIQSLNPRSVGTDDVLDAIKNGLAAPLDGMGTAFSSSLFGLSGSLILGFLDLQSGQAQNRFYLELENWLTSLTDLDRDSPIVGDGGNVTQAMERLAASVKDGGTTSRTNVALVNLAEGIQGLVKHMRGEQQLLRDWVETQSASQSDIKHLLTRLNQALSTPPSGRKSSTTSTSTTTPKKTGGKGSK